MLDVWVCSNCHSLNRERSTVCYKCGGPREQSTGEGEGLRPGRAIQARMISGYRSSIEVAMLAGFLILVVVGRDLHDDPGADGRDDPLDPARPNRRRGRLRRDRV
jgi:hypothetical protein